MEDFKELLYDSSVNCKDNAVKFLKDDVVLIERLFRLSISNEKQYSSRASSVLEQLSKNYPYIIKEYLDRIIDNFLNRKEDGVKRNFLKILTHYSDNNLNYSQQEKLLVLCFDLMIDSKQTVAVKVYSMQIIYDISIFIPEIKQELKHTIEEFMERNSSGFKARGNMILKKLNKELKHI